MDLADALKNYSGPKQDRQGLAAMLDPNIVKRGNLLPMGRNKQGGMELAMPQMLVDILKGVELPGQVLQGKPYTEADVTKMAMDVMPAAGLLGRAPAGAFGMNVFHGGPNRWQPEPGFPQGRPRLDKVGTGEGAQAYGHGFYSAETPAVAKDYQRKLSDPDRMRPNESATAKYKPQWDDVVSELNPLHEAQKKAYGPEREVLQAKIESLQKKLDDLHTQMMEETIKQDGVGQLYKLDLPDEDVAKYLDWDAPLSEQPESVRAAIKKLPDNVYNSTELQFVVDGQPHHWSQYITAEMKDSPDARALVERIAKQTGHKDVKWMTYGDWAMENTSGQKFYADMAATDWGKSVQAAGHMQGHVGDEAAAASEALRKAGIPGLKYYDGMSRGEGKGTRNYVTWDQDVLDRTKILDAE